MSRKRRKRAGPQSASGEARSMRRWWLVIACAGIAVLLAIVAWSGNWPRQDEAHEPPSLDTLARENVDPAILASLREARQEVLDNPNSPDRWGHLGLIFAAHALNEEAASCFAAASDFAPGNQRWIYLHARCIALSAPDEAMALLRQCADLPGDPLDTPRLVLVDMLLERYELDAAEQHLKESLAKNDKNPRARFAQARLHFLREEYEACKNVILATHRDIKESYESELKRANRCAAEGRHGDARSIVDAANRQLQASLRQQKTVGTMLATAMWRLDDAEGGRKQQELADQQPDRDWSDPYTRGIDELKTGLKSMLARSDLAYSQERYSDSLTILKRAVAQYPDSLFARIRLGRTRIRLGRIAEDQATALKHYQQAQQQLNAALSIDANSAEAHFRLGVLSLYRAPLANHAKSLAEAEAHFRRAISIKPDFAMAYYNLARCLDKQQKPLDAIAAMRESLSVDPNYLPARRALGGLHMKAGELPEAMLQLERVLESHPDDKQARRWLEMMRRDLGSP